MLYSVLSNSDRVLQSLPEKPDRDQIEALPFDATGNGTTFLPIIKLTTLAGSAKAAEQLNVHAYKAFRETLTGDQRKNNIPGEQRIQLDVLKRPAAADARVGPVARALGAGPDALPDRRPRRRPHPREPSHPPVGV